ncbi:MAG: RimK family alpha-L-glutamate ligase [Pseudomonadota bacterium]
MQNPNTARLAAALRDRGVAVRAVNPERVDLARGTAALTLGGRPVGAPLALVGRSGSNTGAHARALSAMLEATGLPAFPTARALALAGDKLSAGRLLRAAGLPVPDFVEIGPGIDAHAVGARLGWPLVVKAARGSKGRAVRLVTGPEALRSAMAEMLGQGPLLAQRFVAESRGRDIRVMVVGGKALGAMAREAQGSEAFRSNIASGGIGRAVALPVETRRLAEAASRTAGLEIAGIDLLYAGGGHLVCEVNSAPGFIAFEAVTGLDVAGAMAGHVAARVAAL